MGNSAPPPASIDLVGSFARRRGPDIEIVLWAPTKAYDATSCHLSKGSARVSGRIQLVDDEQGQRLVAQVPRSDLSDGQWAISLVQPTGESLRVEARLLVQAERPVVLLWGLRAPKSEVPKPASVSVAKRVAHSGGLALDSALKVLPPETATNVRSSVRRTARRIVK